MRHALCPRPFAPALSRLSSSKAAFRLPTSAYPSSSSASRMRAPIAIF
ncbi:hypothetical protein D1AOALGA4SA_1704 [Olavius algarvensis Delta 1 endosymbiont]|nr:hypothetical protein D1AOALGA4SA_1704 [Olavius algarvensis Delta 1 endosymbiont]